MSGMGRVLVAVGALIAVAGILMILADRLGWPGRLPGDIVIERKNFSFYFPIVTCLLLSALLTLILWLMNGRR